MWSIIVKIKEFKLLEHGNRMNEVMLCVTFIAFSQIIGQIFVRGVFKK